VTAEIEAQFRDAAASRGLNIKELVADGQIHRCDVAGGRRGKGDGAYLLHLDGIPAGGCQNHRDGLGWTPWRADCC
jgi:putative DNA primase/helicase